ncbi:hypothetical protein RvY_10805 [Ramazzottius varieornatus]|uniref:F-box domain-containing protein n=1 Tax=Ramazzottius varieornatus TaxID=947166 RepID=A0A1D1VDZ9_RAMVA|nr:hypothetical protein RvY_10805 [Ramazzottius varieornatus]
MHYESELSQREPTKLTELPVELLERLGQYLSPKDLLQSVPAAHPYLNNVFSDQYWRSRVRRNFPEAPPDDVPRPFRTCLASGRSKTSERSSWKQYGAHLEWRHRQFARNHLTSTSNSLSNAAATFTALSFADQGNLVLYALANDKGRIHVTTTASLGKDEWSDAVNSQHVMHKHQRTCTQIQSSWSRISSAGSWDSRIAIYDLQPFQLQYLLETGSQVDAHAFMDQHHIVVKTRDGTISLFDVRASLQSPVQHIPAFQRDCTFICSLLCDDRTVITGGDERDFNWLKRIDLRTNHVVANAQVCKFEPNFNTQDGSALHLSEGVLWVGGLTSDAVAYSPSTLEVLHDFGPSFGLPVKKSRRVCGLHYNERQLLLVKNNSCTMLDIWKKPKVIWKHAPEIYCSHMDFDYKRSMMLVCGYDFKNPGPNGEPAAVMKLLKPDENFT